MRNITNGMAIDRYTDNEAIASSAYGLSTITLPLETPLRNTCLGNNNGNVHDSQSLATGIAHNLSAINNNYTNGDLASVDSSDTYASCQTHPFVSQADLDQDVDNVYAVDLDLSNLYINPLEKTADGNVVGRSTVKKSASGDTALRNLCSDAISPMRDVGLADYRSAFEPQHSGSHISLNETTLIPKHRKARFQQGIAVVQMPRAIDPAISTSGKPPKARFEIGQSQENINDAATTAKKKARSSFMPAKSLASATKLINQHLFGIQNVSLKSKICDGGGDDVVLMKLTIIGFIFR